MFLSILGRVFRSTGDSLRTRTAVLPGVCHGAPPPVSGDHGLDDVETRIIVALICAAHF
jgi:hypothetical protein